MLRDSAAALDEDFITCVRNQQFPSPRVLGDLDDVGLSKAHLVEIFESQITNRLLDIHARKLRATGDCFYTIGSSGHEGNAVVAAALKVTDPAFLHYRSGSFYIQRSKQLPGQTPIWDLLLSFTARADDPISGGRHKVLGSKALNIPPQTSTIASHLPKAVGTALSIATATRLGLELNMPEDAIVMCNFGDASSNHTSAQGAFNLASWCAYQNLPLPIIFLCEDNGLGISVNTPEGWVEQNFSSRPKLKYIQCDGLSITDTWAASQEAAHFARTKRQPVFLHMSTVRLMGHAGADAEVAYRTKQQIEETHQNDPLLHAASLCVESGALNHEQIIQLYQDIDQRIAAIGQQVIKRRKIRDAEEVMSSLIPAGNNNPTKSYPLKPLDSSARNELFEREGRVLEKKHPLGRLINLTLAEIMAEQENVVVFGEDVGKKGGVYHVTARLQEKFGPARVFNTLLDETSILGAAMGFSQNNILPIPEIQFLAYVHNAEDQIRGEAATLSFFSKGQYTNPMVVRIAGLAYQKGFGGHFHNDNSFAIFRDIPGVIIACPSNGADAVAMLRESVRVAQTYGRVVIFLEPIALYMTRDLHEQGDEGWASQYPSAHQSMSVGELGVSDAGNDPTFCIVTYGNGYYLSRQAADFLAEKHKVKLRVIDLRWLAPLNEAAILIACEGIEQVLIVDECRKTGSISEALFTLFVESNQQPKQLARITAEDSFIPLADAANLVLPSKQSIIDKVLSMQKDGAVQ